MCRTEPYGWAAIIDAELAGAVEGRAHWQPSADGRAVVYGPPGSAVSVRVQRVHQPAKRERYIASVMRGDRASSATPFPAARDAVRWAEQLRSASG